MDRTRRLRLRRPAHKPWVLSTHCVQGRATHGAKGRRDRTGRRCSQLRARPASGVAQQDATGAQGLSVSRRSAPRSIRTSKSPRWKSGLFISPFLFLSSGKKHWLLVKTDNDYAMLRLDKGNYKLILADLEMRTGLRVGSARGEQVKGCVSRCALRSLGLRAALFGRLFGISQRLRCALRSPKTLTLLDPATGSRVPA